MALTKYIIASRAKPGLSRAEALTHLRNTHAPIVEASTTLRLSLKRYIQNHVIGPASSAAAWDWVVEGWYDEAVPVEAMVDRPDLAAVQADLQRFPDWSSLLRFPVTETPERGGGGDAEPFKCFEFIRRKPSYSSAEFLARWSARERLVREPGGAGARIRNIPLVRGPDAPEYDLVDVRCFAALEDALTRQRALVSVFDGGRGRGVLLDRSRSCVLVTQQHVIFDDVALDV